MWPPSSQSIAIRSHYDAIVILRLRWIASSFVCSVAMRYLLPIKTVYAVSPCGWPNKWYAVSPCDPVCQQYTLCNVAMRCAWSTVTDVHLGSMFVWSTIVVCISHQPWELARFTTGTACLCAMSPVIVTLKQKYMQCRCLPFHSYAYMQCRRLTCRNAFKICNVAAYPFTSVNICNVAA